MQALPPMPAMTRNAIKASSDGASAQPICQAQKKALEAESTTWRPYSSDRPASTAASKGC